MKASKERDLTKKSSSEFFSDPSPKEPRPSSAPHVDSENIFAYNNKFSSMFKKKEENDDDFYNNLKNLNDEMLKSKMSIEYNNAETLSIKEETLFNKEFLNLINSPFVLRKKSNVSNYSDGGMSDCQKVRNGKISTTSLTKVLKLGLQKGNTDSEFLDYQKQIIRKISNLTNGGSDRPSPFIDNEKREIVGLNNTPNIKDFLGSSSTTPVLKNFNEVIPEANENLENAIDFQTFSSNKNFIPKENFIVNPFSKSIPNQNETKEKNEKRMNFNANFNMFNYNFGDNQEVTNFNGNVSNQPNFVNQPQIQNQNYSNSNYNYGKVMYAGHVNNLNFNKKYEMNEYDYPKTLQNFQGYQDTTFNQNYDRQYNNFNQPNYINGDQLANQKPKYIKQNINYEIMENLELLNYVNILGKDQAGCRMLQKRIHNDSTFANQVYIKLRSNIIEYMYDSFGNYLIQKILENIQIDKIQEIIFSIENHFLSLGCSPHGTRVIQKIIEVIQNDYELVSIFIQILKSHSLSLMKDINGNHIIIKFVFCFPQNNDFIFELLNTNIIEICTHKHGCCVLQKCIEGANENQSRRLILNIIKNTKIFILDQYGNYVVQFVIMMNNHEVNKNFVLEIFKNDINFLSKQRFSSNVIEKCFDNSNQETKDIIIKELAKPEIIYSLLFDMYGNYVLQKALALSSDPYYSTFLKHISSHLDELRNFSSFGNKLYVKLINTYPNLINNSKQGQNTRKTNETQQKGKPENVRKQKKWTNY